MRDEIQNHLEDGWDDRDVTVLATAATVVSHRDGAEAEIRPADNGRFGVTFPWGTAFCRSFYAAVHTARRMLYVQHQNNRSLAPRSDEALAARLVEVASEEDRWP